jgi:hypothetical protein
MELCLASNPSESFHCPNAMARALIEIGGGKIIETPKTAALAKPASFEILTFRAEPGRHARHYLVGRCLCKTDETGKPFPGVKQQVATLELAEQMILHHCGRHDQPSRELLAEFKHALKQAKKEAPKPPIQKEIVPSGLVAASTIF